jgi:hypothetical protein
MDKSYIETVRLLLEAAPVIFETPVFAMKGGTAIRTEFDPPPFERRTVQYANS